MTLFCCNFDETPSSFTLVSKVGGIIVALPLFQAPKDDTQCGLAEAPAESRPLPIQLESRSSQHSHRGESHRAKKNQKSSLLAPVLRRSGVSLGIRMSSKNPEPWAAEILSPNSDPSILAFAAAI